MNQSTKTLFAFHLKLLSNSRTSDLLVFFSLKNKHDAAAAVVVVADM
ncbi:hypothetical protein [Candidatus Nitrosocosmicus hydrocola]|nr:hypothetical protein [Candidatus Nitrosocosmicus hydrocola]